jgi:hypothetical protein
VGQQGKDIFLGDLTMPKIGRSAKTGRFLTVKETRRRKKVLQL